MVPHPTAFHPHNVRSSQQHTFSKAHCLRWNISTQKKLAGPLRGDSRLAAEKYLLAVQAATDKLSDTRIWSFMSYYAGFIVNPATSLDNRTYGYVPAEDKDIKMLNSFLDNPYEPAIIRTHAAIALATIYNINELGRRDDELAAIYARRCIQECFNASTEERNILHQPDWSDGTTRRRLGDILDNMRDTMSDMLDLLEFPAKAFASLIASLPYPVIATSYGFYAKQALVELFGDGVSLDHLARRLTVGGVTCDCCGRKRDHADLCSLLCCDSCEMAYYCSAECQRRQWREGGHNKVCRQPGEFREGDAIRLYGLKATTQYNNRFGVAVRQADNSGNEERRWAVRTYEPNGPCKMLSIKESNMRRIRPADIKS